MVVEVNQLSSTACFVTMAIWWLGAWMVVCLCVSPVIDWKPAQGVPHLSPSVSWIGSTPLRIGSIDNEWMDEQLSIDVWGGTVQSHSVWPALQKQKKKHWSGPINNVYDTSQLNLHHIAYHSLYNLFHLATCWEEKVDNSDLWSFFASILLTSANWNFSVLLFLSYYF